MKTYVWEFNASTGNHTSRVEGAVRLIRMGANAPYLYNAEDWGDYSLRFPISGGWYATPAQALRALKRLL